MGVGAVLVEGWEGQLLHHQCKSRDGAHERNISRIIQATALPRPCRPVFEWQKVDAKTKQPYAIALKDGDLFAFAGLWKTWKDKVTGETKETYTVITTDPNEVMEPLHNRMPVVLAPNDYELWMASADPAKLPIDLLRPYPAEEMTAWKVSAAVGNVRNNEPSFTERIE